MQKNKNKNTTTNLVLEKTGGKKVLSMKLDMKSTFYDLTKVAALLVYIQLLEKIKTRKKLKCVRVPAVAKWDWQRLCSTRTWLQSLVWHSWVKDLTLP